MKATVLAILLASTLFAAIPPVPALGLSASACRVKNTDTGVTALNLQAAVTAARPGHHLTVRGICRGTTTIGKDLTISGVRPRGAVPPKLDGDQNGSVVIIARGRTATLKSLTVTDGSGTIDDIQCAGTDKSCGGGIWNHGRLTLISVRVVGNIATFGGGIHNQDDVIQPTLKLKGNTSVSGNSAIGSIAFGGGVDNDGRLILYGSSRISGNTSDRSAAGVYSEGPLILYGSSKIIGNTANDGDGGGAQINGGSLKLYASSRISGNTVSDGRGGGVDLSGSLILHGLSQISGNSAPDGQGGGVFVHLGTFDTSQCGTGKRVRDNTGGDCAP